MTEMIKVSYKNLYGRGILSKAEYQKKLRMYRPDEFMEMPKEEYEAKLGKAPVVGHPPEFAPPESIRKKKEKGILD
jgi:hypothetical protein